MDPYYLTHEAEAIGHHAERILAGRRTNDNMGRYVVAEVVKLMAKHYRPVPGSRILVLGLTFKENTRDIRNTQVVDILRELETYNAAVDLHDPWVDSSEAAREYGIRLTREPSAGAYDAVIVLGGHREFQASGPDGIRRFLKQGGAMYDIKSVFPPASVDGRL